MMRVEKSNKEKSRKKVAEEAVALAMKIKQRAQEREADEKEKTELNEKKKVKKEKKIEKKKRDKNSTEDDNSEAENSEEEANDGENSSRDSPPSDEEKSSEEASHYEVKEDKEIVEEPEHKYTSFKDFDLVPELLEACERLNYSSPTPIQSEAIPWGLKGRDLIGLAQTGSGKTAAFAIPILQSLWEIQTPYFACVLSPTRELAYQIKETFDALGAGMGCKSVCIVGGVGMMDQARDLMKKPHIIVATPGRLLDHLEHTKGFSLRLLKYLVLDEADRLLELEFGPALNKIFEIIPTRRTTYLFSATMTSKVQKLQRASLVNPVKCAVNDKYTTADLLVQSMIFIPNGLKDTHLIRILNSYTGKTIIIFTRTIAHCQRTAYLGRILGFPMVPLHGQLSQSKRLGALNKFKSGAKQILVATDVAARGLDIPSVDLVINYDIPTDSKTYIHRVGRTARAGKSGRSISLVSQYDIELLLRIEQALGKKLENEVVDKQEIAILHKTVDRAMAQAISEFKAFQENNQRKGRFHRDMKDREER